MVVRQAHHPEPAEGESRTLPDLKIKQGCLFKSAKPLLVSRDSLQLEDHFSLLDEFFSGIYPAHTRGRKPINLRSDPEAEVWT